MTKQDLRKDMLLKRARLSDKITRSEKIVDLLLKQPFFQNANTILTFVSYKSEPDTHRLIARMLNMGKKVLAPVTNQDGTMDAYAFSSLSELVPSAYGILEPPKTKIFPPEKIDLILVPGCAFNENGYRIGYGGGFYDRYLVNTSCVTCGLFFASCRASFAPDKTDIPLQYIITEEELLSFV